MTDRIDYGSAMHRAMRALIREVLTGVAKDGLPGAHHFFITFDTMHPDVEIADWLSDRYPGDMTVVMQHWFDGLEVGEDGFAVTLSFGNVPVPLFIPYEAIRTFVDPSVEFGLKFETQDDEETEGAGDAAAPPPTLVPDRAEDAPDAVVPLPDPEVAKSDAQKPGAQDAPAKPKSGKAEVVSLDKFRK
ncbi:MAG: SspB family protein [Paracoccaceae bacterium]